MLDPVAAHVKIIQRDSILGEAVTDTVEGAELPLDGIFRSQHVDSLNIQLVALILIDCDDDK